MLSLTPLSISGLLTAVLLIVSVWVAIWFLMLLHYRRRLALRQDRTPENFTLLRGPGEYLREKLVQLEERLDNLILNSLMAFVLAIGLPAAIGLIMPATRGWSLWVTLVVLMVLACVWTYRQVSSIFDERRCYRLGYLGERMVGEELQKLVRQGWWVYHDVPAVDNGCTFNLDHVAIGPGGVVAIEVKTRRQRENVSGLQKVVYDGASLRWPWGCDDTNLKQAESQAAWLQRKIRETTRKELPVRAVLAIPGWRVDQAVPGGIKVVTGRGVTDAVLGRYGRILSDADIREVAEVLDDLCRNVTQ